MYDKEHLPTYALNEVVEINKGNSVGSESFREDNGFSHMRYNPAGEDDLYALEGLYLFREGIPARNVLRNITEDDINLDE